MHDAIRYNIVAVTDLDPLDLVDDFGAFMTALGATDLAAYAQDEDIRASITAGEVTSRIVPATNFAAWFPPGTDLSRGVMVAMSCESQYDENAALIRKLFEVIIAGSPTHSLDMDAMTPLLMAGVMGLGLLEPVQSIKDGEIEAYAFPSGWRLLTEPVEHPDKLYGVE